MNKTEFISAVAEKANVTKKDAEACVNAFADVVGETLRKGRKSGDAIQLTGFGTFKTSYREAREGINPKNPKEKVEIPACYVTYFSAGKQLKDTINAPAEKKVAAGAKKVVKKKKK